MTSIDLSSLETLRLGRKALNGKDDSSCSLTMRSISNERLLIPCRPV